MIYSCTHMATVGVKVLRKRGKNLPSYVRNKDANKYKHSEVIW